MNKELEELYAQINAQSNPMDELYNQINATGTSEGAVKGWQKRPTGSRVKPGEFRIHQRAHNSFHSLTQKKDGDLSPESKHKSLQDALDKAAEDGHKVVHFYDDIRSRDLPVKMHEYHKT